jgi:hypothetical protein
MTGKPVVACRSTSQRAFGMDDTAQSSGLLMAGIERTDWQRKTVPAGGITLPWVAEAVLFGRNQ